MSNIGPIITTREPLPTIPAGEITVNLGLTGPHYTIGAACAAGNAGIIQGVQMLRLGECDQALAGGVSESIRAFGIFAGFKKSGSTSIYMKIQQKLAVPSIKTVMV